MRHGYFISQTNQLYGDEEFALESRSLYFQVVNWSPVAGGGRYDGMSIFIRADGTVVKRLAEQATDEDEFKVRVRDL